MENIWQKIKQQDTCESDIQSQVPDGIQETRKEFANVNLQASLVVIGNPGLPCINQNILSLTFQGKTSVYSAFKNPQTWKIFGKE